MNITVRVAFEIELQTSPTLTETSSLAAIKDEAANSAISAVAAKLGGGKVKFTQDPLVTKIVIAG